MKKIICLYGGPGAGKSTTCAGVYYKLKMAGHNCEMNREYIKEWVWEGREVKDGDQTYFFAKSARKERLYMNQNLDFIITDSPLILTHYYGLKYDPCEQKSNTSEMMLNHHATYCKDKGYKVDHFIIKREKEYNPAGRFQDAETAATYDVEIQELLDEKGIKYEIIEGGEEAVNEIIKSVMEE